MDVYSRCVSYDQRCHEARIHNRNPGPPPEGYDEYLREGEEFYYNDFSDRRRPLIYRNAIPDNNVTMPADTLAMIVRALGQNNQANHPTPRFNNPPPHRPIHPLRPFNRPPPPPPKKRANPGKGKPTNNRRPKKSGRTEDPRRRNKNPDNAPANAGPSGNVEPPAPNTPINQSEIITEVNPIVSEIDFLADFNADINALGGDAIMNSIEAGDITV